DINEEPQWVVVRLVGEGNYLAAESLQRSLTGLTVRRPSLVVFDLSELSFVASLMLGVLINFRRGLVRNGGRGVLPSLQPNVFEVLQAAGLHEVFEITSRVDEVTEGM